MGPAFLTPKHNKTACAWQPCSLPLYVLFLTNGSKRLGHPLVLGVLRWGGGSRAPGASLRWVPLNNNIMAGPTFVGMGVSRLTWSHFIPTASLAVGPTFVGMAFGLEKGHFPKTWHPYRHPCAFVGRHLSVFFLIVLLSFLLSYTPSSKWQNGRRETATQLTKTALERRDFQVMYPPHSSANLVPQCVR